MECRQKITADVTNVVEDGQCAGSKPHSSEPCNQKDCEPDWVPGDWSMVSYRCLEVRLVKISGGFLVFIIHCFILLGQKYRPVTTVKLWVLMGEM